MDQTGQAPGASKLRGGAQFVIYAEHPRSHGAFRHGMCKLLLGIRATGSIEKASKSMLVSHSSARRMLAETEDTLRYRLVETHPHGSTLTPQGARLLEVYLQISTEIEAFAELRFAELMREVDNSNLRQSTCL